MAQETYDDTTAWTGWIAFAGVIMIIGGTLNAIYGLIAIVNGDWVGWSNTDNVTLDVSAWGWVALLVGIVVAASGFGVFTGNVLARTVGVIVAGISMIANFFFIPVHPIWAILVITIDMLIIWALTAHGREMKNIE